MSLSDPIAGVLTRLRNASCAKHDSVYVFSSNLILHMVNVLKKEGFIVHYQAIKNSHIPLLKISLKYYNSRPVLRGLQRISKPGRRVYIKHRDIRPAMNSMGLSVLSTPKGVLSDKEAKLQRVGGEVICKVW